MIKKNTVFLNGRKIGTYEFVQKTGSGHINFNGFDPYEAKLTDDQQVVLDYLKKMCPPELGVSAMVTVYCLVDDNINDNWQEYSEEIPEHIEALQKLSISDENQVLAAFAEWGSKEANQ